MPQLPSRNSTFDRPGTAAAAGPDRLQPGPIGGFDGTAMAPAAIADSAAGLAAALHSPRMTGAEREVKVTMKLAARLTLGLLLLGVSVQTAMAAEWQPQDPTAAVAVFDWSHRMDANGYKGR